MRSGVNLGSYALTVTVARADISGCLKILASSMRPIDTRHAGILIFLSQQNFVNFQSRSETTRAGFGKRTEGFTHDEGNTFFALTRKLHASIQTRKAPLHNRLKKPWLRRNRFSLPCRRPLRIAVLHSCQYCLYRQEFSKSLLNLLKNMTSFNKVDSENSTKQWVPYSTPKCRPQIFTKKMPNRVIKREDTAHLHSPPPFRQDITMELELTS